MSKKNELGDLQGLPPWMATMRKAAMESISEADIKDIVTNRVAAAKKGDKDAIKFVFDYLLGGNQLKGATFIQNNNYGANPTEATDARPGTDDKIDTMRRRADAGLPLHTDGDGGEANLD